MVVSETKRKFTYEDYAKTPEDERYELLDGELIMAAAPNMAHQRVGMQLGGEFYIFVVDQNLGEVYVAPTDVYLTDTDVVQPDILFFSKDRSYIRTGKNIRGAPDLVVEILSPSTSANDWGYKKDLYERHGVKEFWLVDPYAKQVIVMLLEDGSYEIVGVYREDDTLRSPTLEGFELDLSRVFDEVFEEILADVLEEMS
jgi:Uma2 family endonuclease